MFRKTKPNIFQIATQNKQTFQQRIANELIYRLDQKIERESKNGETSCGLFYAEVNHNVRNEALYIMRDHYEYLGFEVSFDEYKKDNNSSLNRSNLFYVYW